MTDLSIAELFTAAEQTSFAKKSKTIHRAEHSRENPFTVLSNKMLRDKTIRHSDRGLLAQILSWSDNHFLCVKALVKQSVEGRDAIRGMIDRLVTAGYIRVQQLKGSDGKFGQTVYEIYEESTGVLASLDLTGIIENESELFSPQLDLFECELELQAMNNESVNQTADGKAVNGKPDPNNNYTGINTNSSNSANAVSPEKQGEPETKESLLNKWKLDLNDGVVKARLGMANLLTFITTQEQLNLYLIDFNQQYEKYKHLNHTQRLKNFTAYLVRIKHTPIEYAKHLSRLRALGFDVQLPVRKSKKPEQQSRPVLNVNPFEVKNSTPIEAPQFSMSIEGF